MRIREVLSLILLVAAPCARAHAAEIDVFEWNLDTTVRYSGVGEDNRFSGIPTNPFSVVHTTSLGTSAAQSIYDASWSGSGRFEFLVAAAHVSQGNPFGFSGSFGVVRFSPSVDSIFTVDIGYNYAMAAGDREAKLMFNVGGGPAPGGSIFANNQLAGTIGDPPIGSFMVHESIPLIAGELYAFNYLLELRSFSGSPTSLSAADGHVRVSIVPAPEPSTLLLLALVGAVSRVGAARGARRAPASREAKCPYETMTVTGVPRAAPTLRVQRG